MPSTELEFEYGPTDRHLIAIVEYCAHYDPKADANADGNLGYPCLFVDIDDVVIENRLGRNLTNWAEGREDLMKEIRTRLIDKLHAEYHCKIHIECGL